MINAVHNANRGEAGITHLAEDISYIFEPEIPEPWTQPHRTVQFYQQLIFLGSGFITILAAICHHSTCLLIPFLGAVLDDETGPESQMLDENGRKVFLAIVRLKERGELTRQSDIAREAGIGARTLATYRANNALLARIIDEAIIFCLDKHLLNTTRKLQSEGGPITYARIALEAAVAVETLRRRREANKELNKAVETIISSTHPSDLKIMAAVSRLNGRRGSSFAYADVVREADVDSTTLRTRMYANLTLRDAVNSIVLSTDNRILRAIDELAGTGAEIDQKTIAEHADLDPSTVTNRKNSNSMIQAALERVIRSTDDRILAAINQLQEQRKEITQNLVAEMAGVTPGTIVHRKEQNPRLRKTIDDAVLNCMYRLIETVVLELNEEGVSVTQQLIAQRIGISEAAIVYRKEHNPDIYELIESTLPQSAAERIRQAKEGLALEGIPCSQLNLAIRAGLNPSTVSKVLSKNSQLAEGILLSKPRGTLYVTLESCREALTKRIRIYGNETCNAASSLRQPMLRGGNPSLLRACRRLGITLPIPQTERKRRLASGKAVLPEYNPMNGYLERISATKPLMEQDAVDLWERIRAGDKDAQDDFLVRCRPLVKFVIEDNLHERIDPSGFKTELVWHLITEGDLIIAAAIPEWERKGRLLWMLHRRLQDGLTSARHEFFKQRQQQTRQEISINEPLSGSEASGDFDLEQSRLMASHNIPPDEVLGILSDSSTFGEEDLVAKRDAASGVPVVSGYDKQVLASSLCPVFGELGFNTALESGFGNKWAVFIAGSLGRLGTAVVGNCSFKAIVLTDATPEFLHQAVRSIARNLADAIIEKHTTLVIGRGQAYDRVMQLVNGSDREQDGLRHFVLSLQRFGIGLTPYEGMATIQFLPVETETGHAMMFELLKNALLCAESEENSRSILIRKILQGLRNQPPEDAGRAMLDAQITFLRDQRAGLERVKRRTRQSE